MLSRNKAGHPQGVPLQYDTRRGEVSSPWGLIKGGETPPLRFHLRMKDDLYGGFGISYKAKTLLSLRKREPMRNHLIDRYAAGAKSEAGIENSPPLSGGAKKRIVPPRSTDCTACLKALAAPVQTITKSTGGTSPRPWYVRTRDVKRSACIARSAPRRLAA